MTIFSKIIRGEIPSYKVAENEEFYAFLDINPVQPGHTLVVPKREVDYIFDLNDEELARMVVFAKKIAKAIQEVKACKKVAMSVIGLEVPHAHIHLVPINDERDLRFGSKSTELSADEMASHAHKISQALKNN